MQHASRKGRHMHDIKTHLSSTLHCYASQCSLAAYDLACSCCWQAFDGGEHLVHSGMSASALYLFERLYSLAKVRTTFMWCMLSVHLLSTPRSPQDRHRSAIHSNTQLAVACSSSCIGLVHQHILCKAMRYATSHIHQLA